MSTSDKSEYYSAKRLRWNTLVFTGGKGVNAMLSLGIFYLIAANLSKADFAVYAWLIAFIELSNNISRFGINWAVDRYVPELRSSLNSFSLRRFILIMTGLRALVITALAALFYAAGQILLEMGGKEDWLPAFDIYIVLLIPFALMVFLRDVVFQSLLQQAHSQGTTSLRHLVFMCVIGYILFGTSSLTLTNVIYGEIIATFIAVTAALIQAGILIRQFPYNVAPRSDSPLSWRVVLRFAANSYANELLRMSGSGHAVMSAAPQLLATAALAPYGFCQTLFAQINRFVPAHLFSGLYRPKLVAEYTKTGSFEALNRRLITILKISNYILALSLAVFFVYGGILMDWLSKGKYGDAHGLMMLFVLLMLVDNYRQVLMALCNTIERVDFLRRASLIMPLVLPLASCLVWAGFGAYGLVLALILPEIICVATIMHQIKRAGHDLKFDMPGQARIAASAFVAVIVGLAVQYYYLSESVVSVLVGIALTGMAFIIAAKLFRPLCRDERAALERLVGRKLYLL